ncbi:MAG: putative Ig domain-containing protein [Streptosporangiaceae bacterium]
MRKLSGLTLAIAGSLVVVAPTGPASAAGGGFAVSRILAGGRLTDLAADPAAGLLYVAEQTSAGAEVAVINAVTHEIVSTIPVPTGLTDVAVDPVTDTVYAVSESPGAVTVIDGATDAVTSTLSLPSNAIPAGAAVNPLTHTLYVADGDNQVVDVFDTVSLKQTATIALTNRAHEPNPGISAIAVDSAANRVYVSDASDNMIAVINGSSAAVTHRISLPSGAFPRGIAVGSGAVYVADQGANAVTVIDPATDTISATVTGTAGVSDVALGPTGTLYAVAPEGGQFNIGATYVIDTGTAQVTSQVPRGGEWVGAVSGSVYLSNGYAAFGESVTVITPSAATTMCPLILDFCPIRVTLGYDSHIRLSASATPSATFSATGLPAGLTLSPAGLLSGTPTGPPGTSQVEVTAANGTAPADTETVDIEVEQPPVITSAAQATFHAGTDSYFDAIANGYPWPTFAEAGALPKGVKFHHYSYLYSGYGEFAGAPAQGTGGRYPITLTASDGAGKPATQEFTLIVDQPPAFLSPFHVNFRAGTRKTFTIKTSGYPPAQLTESGKLPAGIVFRPGHHGTATISGTAFRRDRGRTFLVTITARNGAGGVAHQRLAIIIHWRRAISSDTGSRTSAPRRDR